MRAKTYRFVKRALIIVLVSVISVALSIIFFANDGGSAVDGVYRFFGVFPQPNVRDDFISFLDVGQGDSILISSNGYNALVDTGPPESESSLLEELEEFQVDNIDVLIVSHLHNDHTGGLPGICQNYSIDNLIAPELEKKSNKDTEVAKESVLSMGGKVYTAKSGMNFTLGDFEITILGYYSSMQEENNRSVISMAKIGDYKFLLTGDAQAKAENELLLDGINVDCDVLKAGHHGSKTSTTNNFLKKASPEFSVISVGKNNEYNHPSASVIEKLEKVSQTIRTDESGTITFYIENDILKYELEKR